MSDAQTQVLAGRDLEATQELAEQLVVSAREQGIALTGPDGLLTGLTRQVLQTALEAEMTEHLGHEHGGMPGPGGNVRNGHSAKTVRTEIGDVRIQVPRDREGSFEPVLVPKHTRRPAGFDETVISLYAKGMTTGDIGGAVHRDTQPRQSVEVSIAANSSHPRGAHRPGSRKLGILRPAARPAVAPARGARLTPHHGGAPW
ncbi:MAG: hypothetical protein GXX79_11310 [Actinomycetales bacterium]|nr:hypothetical protein [Actinomycetales bacterium]